MRVRVVEGMNSGRFPFCNVVLVDNILIDAGAGLGIIKELLGKVEILLLSHTHPDHASAAWLFNKAGKRVFSPETQTDLDSLARRFAGELAEEWKEWVARDMMMRSFESEPLDAIADKLADVEPIHTPGHTRDHHAFLIDGKIVYGADIDLVFPFYGNPEASIDGMLKSIEKIAQLDAELFIPAHSRPISGKERIRESLEEYAEIIKGREERILELLKEERSLEELVELSPIYGKKPYAKKILDYFERNMVEKHLEKLIREGRVKRVEKVFKAVRF
ncbi:MAG: MBL fold metallo-hydrolase [Archaeoglobaceae archaeon]